jgi:hypothetical protein
MTLIRRNPRSLSGRRLGARIGQPGKEGSRQLLPASDPVTPIRVLERPRHAREEEAGPSPPDAGDVQISRSLAGRVMLDRAAGTASKIYTPPLLVRLLYRLAFQAPFPYVRNSAALQAAEARRQVAGLLTRFWYGRDLVAPVLRIEPDEAGLVFVTKLIEGGRPSDKRRARAFLTGLRRHFVAAGLPTWQVDPLNPRAVDNLVETPDGSYRIIDLESGLVSPIMPLGQWLAALRSGQLPVFDDVFVEKAKRYVLQHGAEIQDAIGPSGLAELEIAIERYDDHAHAWHAAEPRVWSRLIRLPVRLASQVFHSLQLLRPSRISAAGRNLMRRGTAVLDSWLRSGITRLREEGNLGEDEAMKLEASLDDAETPVALSHLGAHMAMTVPLRFPFGSIGRFMWTLSFRLSTEWKALVKRRSHEEIRSGRRVHTVPVMLLSVIPGIGAAAYVASVPVRRNPRLAAVLLDQTLSKLPFKLYETLRLRPLVLRLLRPTSPERLQTRRNRQTDTAGIWTTPSPRLVESVLARERDNVRPITDELSTVAVVGSESSEQGFRRAG